VNKVADKKAKLREVSRHGEIVIEKLVDKIASEFLTHSVKMAKNGVLAEGEVTGHMHKLEGENGVGYKLYELADGKADLDRPVRIESTEEGALSWRRKVLEIPASEFVLLIEEGSVHLTHPEHGTIKLRKGHYVIRTQREYDEERSRKVLD
jgi:hypothetical protein